MNTLAIIAALKDYKVVPRLDGHQLKLVGETKQLPAELVEQVRNSREELIRFLRNAMEQSAYTPIPRVPLQENYPASHAQQRIWVLSQLEGGSTAYHIVRSFYLKGRVLKENLEKAFQACIRRHESLRTVFREINGELRQVVLEDIPFTLGFSDLSNIPDPKEYLKEAVKQFTFRPFDTGNGPLLHVTLFQIAAEEFALIFGVHHIVSDGWSIGVLVQELMQAYELFCNHLPLPVVPLPIQYKDYCQWHAARVAGEQGQRAKAFWQNEFITQAEPLQLPADFPRPAIKSFQGALTRYYPGEARYAQILAFCKDNQVTTFNFFRATLTILLSRFSGQQDITIGIPVSGRNHLDIEGQIGLYINTLPLRTTLQPGISFRNFLQEIAEHSLRAFEFQDYPFDQMVDNLPVQRDVSRNPLFDVMLVLQHQATGEGSVNQRKQYGFELGLLERMLYPSGRQQDEKTAIKFDLTFNLDYDPDNQFYIEIEYDTALFRKERITRLYSAWLHIMVQVMENPAVILGAIDIVPPDEKQRILQAFNAPVGTIDAFSILHLFRESFAHRRDQVALLVNDTAFTYGQLDNASTELAAKLQAIYPTGAPLFAGILMGRSAWTLISMLGAWKAGAAYVPIDTNYPASRINYIIRDAQLSCLIADEEGSALIPPEYNGHIIPVGAVQQNDAGTNTGLPAAADLREQTAYLIYTSGSTGNPKGVEICHRNAIAFLQWAAREFAHTPFEIVYATTSVCFDLSVFELFFPLMQGKPIRLLPSATAIPNWLEKDKQVLINTVPSVVRSLLEQSINWQAITALNMAGEPVPGYFKNVLDHTRIEVRNLYGPSEATTYSTQYRFVKEETSAIPIGAPIEYTQLYILDNNGNIQPIGVDGEICLGGQAIAKGYLHQPRHTAERFVNNPFLPGSVMYKTGDIGQWTENGQVLFAGRMDDQVKIRGYRIEPGEIQYRLEQHPLVHQAIVMPQEINGEQELVAFIQGDETVTPPLLKDYLSALLPAYMIPARWMMLDTIPLNSNGKVDKKRLPVYDIFTGASAEKVLPQSAVQQQLWLLWKEVLSMEPGITDNFFHVGGHSLKAMRLRFLIEKNFQKEITLNEIFAFPSIEAQERLLAGKSGVDIVKIEQAKEQEVYPLSFAQERLWVLTGFEEASVAYNMPAVFKVKGILNIAMLEAAFRLVIDRHEILRTVFTEKDGVPVQRILPVEESLFTIENDIPPFPVNQEEALEQLKAKWQQPFHLSQGPLLSCSVIHTTEGPLLSFNMHHIISDGWSLGILYQQVMLAYQLLQAAQPEQFPRPAIQSKDFAVWQKQQLAAGKMEVHRQYWKTVFAKEVPVLELPGDYLRPDIKTYRGAAADQAFSQELTAKLHQLAVQGNGSLFMTLMTAVRVLLKKYTGEHDIVVGTPVAGREQAPLQDQIGCYVNTLPIRVQIDPEASFLTMLEREKTAILQAFEHQAFSFEMLLEEIAIKRELSRSPLFDVVVVLQDTEAWEVRPVKNSDDGLHLERIPIHTGVSKYDLVFSFAEHPDGLQLTLEYNTSLFSAATIHRLTHHFEKILNEVTITPDKKIKDIRLPDEQELAVLTSKADQSQVGWNTEATIISLFQKAVVAHSHQTALIVGGKQLTYHELDLRSSQLAGILLHDYGILPEDLVLLHTARSEWMLIAILAVLKAGAAYVPIDPDYPPARIAYILDDTASRFILYDEPLAEAITQQYHNRTFINLTRQQYSGEGSMATVRPENLAYVIYTSGTTGNPKGVLIEHRQVTRLLFHDNNQYHFDHKDRWSLFHSYCFDFSVWEMYGALLYGGTLVMVPKTIAQDGRSFYDFLKEEKITVLNQTPTAFRSMLQANNDRIADDVPVRYLIFGGEALMPAMLAPWHKAVPHCTIVNMYGITETTVHVTYKEITGKEIAANTSNIGMPMPTVSCYVLDTDLQQVPVGVVGELCVGGAGVARGYLNKQELTYMKFIAHPSQPQARMYRSGDYARILTNGDIEYIGRRDDQVKIRGHRIELAEVETALIGQPGISDAVVLPLKNATGEYELAAWFIPADAFGNVTQLRKGLNAQLPAYMVPSHLTPLETFPLNSNGKLDKNALPPPQEVLEAGISYVPSRNETDQAILSIWEGVLDRKGIGIKDNFFDLGGHSLKATRVVSKIHETMGVKIDLKALFIEPTIEHLSNYVDTIRWMENKDKIMADHQDEIVF